MGEPGSEPRDGGDGGGPAGSIMERGEMVGGVIFIRFSFFFPDFWMLVFFFSRAKNQLVFGKKQPLRPPLLRKKKKRNSKKGKENCMVRYEKEKGFYFSCSDTM